ncbi:TniQ family protein [Rhodococcus sp. T7]|uniref:TniQ family protein n=1 Tax=Rhodococcus sp. T7 TaxID=627444 RepID=UPI001F466C8D|nr:TniQ family protein [Rhodococcus sp. T7]
MLPRDRAEKIIALHAAGWSGRAIASHLGHSQQTIRDYLHGRKKPGIRARTKPSMLTDPLADYCRHRFAEDPNLRPATVFREVTDLGFAGSKATFYRDVARLLPPRHEQPPPKTQNSSVAPNPFSHKPKRTPVLPRSAAPVNGETLVSYLTRLADANHLTLAEVLAVLPPWFSTKASSDDDRARHHMLVPATGAALLALAHLTSKPPADLAHALPPFGDTDIQGPLRATTACRRCTIRRGIRGPVPVHLPVHHNVCTRHGIWISDADSPQLDLSATPEIITAQRRTNQLLRHHTPQQVTLAYATAVKAVPPWPASTTALPHHWRHRLLRLQTRNHYLGIQTDHDSFTHAAIYPDTVELAAQILRPANQHTPRRSRTNREK